MPVSVEITDFLRGVATVSESIHPIKGLSHGRPPLIGQSIYHYTPLSRMSYGHIAKFLSGALMEVYDNFLVQSWRKGLI